MELGYFKTLKADLYRYTGEDSLWEFIKTWMLSVEFNYIFWLRTTSATKSNLCLKPLHYLLRFYLRRKQISRGIFIAYNTEISHGFYIGHFGNIIVHYQVKIGANCNISSGVTIGIRPRGPKKGLPVIGDNVYIGPGAKIIGNVKIGNNVAIGANSVVTHDAPDNAVIAGIPGKIISYDGSYGYVNNIKDEF